MIKTKKFDVLIIGGSYAGLSAAMSLGRSLRNVLVIDHGAPCNKQTPHSHNFLTQDGKTPLEISSLSKEQVAQYDSVKFYYDEVIEGKITDDGFEVSTKNGRSFTAKKLIFATGIKDIFPNIKGFSSCWGISVIHCPYCHGYEFRYQETAILANGERGIHLASLVKNLTDKVSIYTNGDASFNEEQNSKLKRNSINVIETEILEIIHEDGYAKEIVLRDNSTKSFNAIYAAIPFVQHSDIPTLLGCELTEHGHIKVDNFQKTAIPGLYACGDNCSMMRSVANAVSTGNIAGAMVNMELTLEQF